MILEDKNEMRLRKAVSYTHLDVYKRQPLVITKENVDEMLAILTECLDEKKTS